MREGGCVLEGHTGWYPLERLLRCADVLGEGALAEGEQVGEHLVAGLEPGCCWPDGLDDARDIDSDAMIPGCAQPQEEASEAGSRTESVEVRPVYRSRTHSNKDLVARRIRAVDLPHFHGAGEVLHLMSLISPVDDDLAVVYLPLMPVRLAELLAEREIRLVEVPDEEFETMGPNVLALAPRVALALEGNVETRKRLERAGVDLSVYRGDEISRKGDGGPTCLTRPLLRA